MYAPRGYRPLYGLGQFDFARARTIMSAAFEASSSEVPSAAAEVEAAAAEAAPSFTTSTASAPMTPGITQEGVLASAWGGRAVAILGGALLGGLATGVVMKLRKRGR